MASLNDISGVDEIFGDGSALNELRLIGMNQVGGDRLKPGGQGSRSNFCGAILEGDRPIVS